jgi:acyl carrier protein
MAMSRDDLVQFLRNDVGVDTTEVDDETALFSTGIIDSFSLVAVITFIETQEGIKVDPMDVNLDNFDTINSILAYTQRAGAQS